MKFTEIPPTVKMGAALALLMRGETADRLEQFWQAEHMCKDASYEGFGKLEKIACRIAARAYAEIGAQDQPEFHLFDKLANRKDWDVAFQPIADAAFFGLAKNARFSVKTPVERAVKIGAALRNLAGTVARAGVTMTPAAMRTLMAVTAAGGAGTGALWWMANRHASEDDNELEQQRQKLDYYRQLTKDVTDELNVRGIKTQQS